MKKAIKWLALALALVMVFALASCGGGNQDEATKAPQGEDGATLQAEKDTTALPEDFKIGFLFLHDENSTYDKNFMDAAKEVQQKLGLSDSQVIFKVNIPETAECYNAACELAEEGCNIIIADSFGHESHVLQAAKEYPEVQFCHATGTTAHTEKLPNFHNAFASIYEGRFLAGIAAGMKLNAMIEEGKITAEQAKMGYVGAYPYAEVKSGYTSFFLGAKSVCPSVTMDVKFTNSWYDEALEKEAANALINDKCVLISQHADSMGAPTACQDAGVPNVSYNGSTIAACPDSFIVSSRINWAPYYEYVINCYKDGKTIDTDWTGTIATGSVELTDINESVAAAGTKEAIEAAKAKLMDGSLKVFDTATFTVKGEALSSYMADVDSDAAFTPDTEVIVDGAFSESSFRSAPYFDVDIDGITIK